MQQEQLFYDSAEEAVNAAIVKSGLKPKEVAVELWPAMKMDSAYARLKNALNPDKHEKLTLDEIIHICRVAQRFDPLFYMADELCHTRPILRAPKDEGAELLREIHEQYNHIGAMMKKLEWLKER